MTIRVRFTPKAEEQLEEVKRWRAQNRPAARIQVADVVERVIDLIKAQPGIGLRYKPHKNVRSLRLKPTPVPALL